MASSTVFQLFLHLLHILATLCLRFISFAFRLPRKSPKIDHSVLLPTFNLVPATPRFTPTNIPTSEASDLQIKTSGAWANDKVNFIRNPSLKRATDHKENNNRRKGRIFSKGYADVTTTVPLVDSTPGLAEREWESPSLGSIPASVSHLSLNSQLEERRLSMEDLSVHHATNEARDARVDPSLSDTVSISPSCYGALPCLFQPPNDSASKENQPTSLPLVLRYNPFKSNPNSAVSPQLWDPTPVTLLKPAAIPLLANTDHTPYHKRETLSHYVPYADLFDYSIYKEPASHWTGDFTLDWPTCSDNVAESNDSDVHASLAEGIFTEPGCIAIPSTAPLDDSTNLPADSLPVSWVDAAAA